MTQHWLHGPQAVQALRAGKHVFSAVPPALTLEELRGLVRAVEETRNVYMLGESDVYKAATLYCRRRHEAGDFGDVVYGEAEYYADLGRGLLEIFKQRGGERWREFAGMPPMYYPTHSTGAVLAVTGARMTHVSCQGFVDREDDGLFRADVNRWGNVFSAEVALFRLSDGSSCRVNGFWRVGHPGAQRMSLYGTRGCFEQNRAGAVWLTNGKAPPERLDDALTLRDVQTERGTFLGVNPLHPLAELPAAFAGIPSGGFSAGAAPFLVHDFVRACAGGRQPALDVWTAARYMAPGIVAHESARRGGQLLEIPDFGAPPGAPA
jgi:predicted dehydrogenase